MIGTKIDYLYRDAANYKVWGSATVSGRLSLEQLRPFMFEGEFFIPAAVGMRCLSSEAASDDHQLHEFVAFVETQASEFDPSAKSLLEKFQYVAREGWFGWLVRAGPKRNYSSY